LAVVRDRARSLVAVLVGLADGVSIAVGSVQGELDVASALLEVARHGVDASMSGVVGWGVGVERVSTRSEAILTSSGAKATKARSVSLCMVETP
jgi:hypothetical protein